jgi:hypothetical protein
MNHQTSTAALDFMLSRAAHDLATREKVRFLAFEYARERKTGGGDLQGTLHKMEEVIKSQPPLVDAETFDPKTDMDKVPPELRELAERHPEQLAVDPKTGTVHKGHPKILSAFMTQGPTEGEGAAALLVAIVTLTPVLLGIIALVLEIVNAIWPDDGKIHGDVDVVPDMF